MQTLFKSGGERRGREERGGGGGTGGKDWKRRERHKASMRHKAFKYILLKLRM